MRKQEEITKCIIKTINVKAFVGERIIGQSFLSLQKFSQCNTDKGCQVGDDQELFTENFVLVK